mmetsp:Transcript_28493/g.45925  ORF Transcript_28493/g.45925 Transcript_28493/m.45925 type:complete len:201 (+) Transcript_28493:1393-1995(+)
MSATDFFASRIASLASTSSCRRRLRSAVALSKRHCRFSYLICCARRSVSSARSASSFVPMVFTQHSPSVAISVIFDSSFSIRASAASFSAANAFAFSFARTTASSNAFRSASQRLRKEYTASFNELSSSIARFFSITALSARLRSSSTTLHKLRVRTPCVSRRCSHFITIELTRVFASYRRFFMSSTSSFALLWNWIVPA